jgi:hypothetical protein
MHEVSITAGEQVESDHPTTLRHWIIRLGERNQQLHNTNPAIDRC